MDLERRGGDALAVPCVSLILRLLSTPTRGGSLSSMTLLPSLAYGVCPVPLGGEWHAFETMGRCPSAVDLLSCMGV
jgi:hypothetical protein